MSADPIRDIIAQPLVDYDKLMLERPKLRQAYKDWVDATEFDSPDAAAGAFSAAIAAGPAAAGATATPAQAMAAEFATIADEKHVIGDDGTLAFHQTNIIGGRVQPCAVSGVFGDPKTYQKLVDGVVS